MMVKWQSGLRKTDNQVILYLVVLIIRKSKEVNVSNLNFIDVCLLNCCNYRCQACISNSINAYYEVIGGKRIYTNAGWSLKPMALMKFITAHFSPEDTVIQLSGGEPLLYESLPFIIKDLVGMKYRLGINTNAYYLKQF